MRQREQALADGLRMLAEVLGQLRTWSRPCSTNSMASAISRLNWSLRPPVIDSLAAWPSSRSRFANAGAPSFSLAPASFDRASLKLPPSASPPSVATRSQPCLVSISASLASFSTSGSTRP
ncbi:hypothetical protein [Massilia phosphatilytica]